MVAAKIMSETGLAFNFRTETRGKNQPPARSCASPPRSKAGKEPINLNLGQKLAQAMKVSVSILLEIETIVAGGAAQKLP